MRGVWQAASAFPIGLVHPSQPAEGDNQTTALIGRGCLGCLPHNSWQPDNSWQLLCMVASTIVIAVTAFVIIELSDATGA